MRFSGDRTMKQGMLGFVILAMLPGSGLHAQASAGSTPAVPQWQTAAGSKMEFDVVSVKQNKADLSASNRPYSNFPMGPGDMYSPNGGHFIARNWPLAFYLQFAYKITGGQEQAVIKQMPEWTMTDRYDIEAKVAGEPTKDQMRLMMQALLADRFKL